MKSPVVNFNFINNNVEISTPTNGISAVLARTTKGPANDPSTLINSITKFKEIYGEEIVPDGTISNIEKALLGGSTLRIARVQASDATNGYVGTADATEIKELFKITYNSISVGFGLRTKYKGDKIGSGSSYNFGVAKVGNSILYKVVDADGITILDSGIVTTFNTPDTLNKASFDYIALQNFLLSNKYFEAVITTPSPEVTSVSSLIDWLANTVDGGNKDLTITYNAVALSDTYVLVPGSVGSAGTTPTLENWEASFDSLLDYTDYYSAIASHLAQHLESSDELSFYAYVRNKLDTLNEFQFYIEVPKVNNTKATIIAWITTAIGTIGHSKYICYFAGGIKYYNNKGLLENCDVLGTILGLDNTSAANYGPYKSFAGMNRGLIPDANGPVCINYGSPSRYDDLNDLAQSYANIIVVKNTSISGKVTMLWHNFTSQVKQDSFRFISTVRLSLYIEKQLRPIFESFIEEPNIWGTWKRIYLMGNPIMENLITDNAITDLSWEGDQDATAWKDLKINNEADCRQGKYVAKIHFKDVATMQEITVDLVMDQASKSVNTTVQ